MFWLSRLLKLIFKMLIIKISEFKRFISSFRFLTIDMKTLRWNVFIFFSYAACRALVYSTISIKMGFQMASFKQAALKP